MNVLNDYGVVLSGLELVEYAKRRGLCQICGRTRTHQRPNNLLKKIRNQWLPLTIRHERGDSGTFFGNNVTNHSNETEYLVYKGYCLQPTCYSLEEAKLELGEIELDPCDASKKSFRSEQYSLSMQQFSSARFSASSGTNYEFSIPDQQHHTPTSHRLMRSDQLYKSSSSLSDVSSLGASAVSEDVIEEENPVLRDLMGQKQEQPHPLEVFSPSFPSQSDFDKMGEFLQQSISAFTRPTSPKEDLFAIKPRKSVDSAHSIDDDTDSTSHSETTDGDETFENDLDSEQSMTSLLPPNCLLHDTAPIELPSNYSIQFSTSCRNILTIQRGSLRALDLIISNDDGQDKLQVHTPEEEGFEVAFADDMVTQEAVDHLNPQTGTNEVEWESGASFPKKKMKKARQITLASKRSKKNKKADRIDCSTGILTVFQSAPLTYVHPETKKKYSFPLLDFAYESQLLMQSLQDAHRIGSRVRIETEIATVDRLSAFFAQGGRKVLHLSCHGHPEYLLLENGFGSAHPLPVKDLKRFVAKADLDLVFVSACYSRSAGEAFVQAGVKHVVCCRQDSVNVRDEAATEFARHFYRALACHKPLKEAFELAKATVGVSPLFPNAKEESEKFLLLPETCDDSYHNILISFQDNRRVANTQDAELEESGQSYLCLEMLNRLPERFIGREEDLFDVLDAVRGCDWVHIYGEHGVGKSTLVAAACTYISQRPTSFMRDCIVWIKGPDDARRWKKSARQVSHPSLRPLMILDTRGIVDEWELTHQVKFLREVFAGPTQVKLVTIGIDRSITSTLGEYSSVSPRSLRLGRLNHHDSICLFSCKTSSSQYTPQELAAILSMCDSQTKMGKHENASVQAVVDALHNFRKNKVYHRIGDGLPKRIVHFASNMTEEELADCVRWANRTNENTNETASASLPVTRVELEELIRCTLAKEARALREECYADAREHHETLEEWQSLRSILPTRDAIKQELSSLYPKLQESIRLRRYKQAEELQKRKNWLENQLRREDEYSQTEERFQETIYKAREMSFHSATGSVCSRSSLRSVGSASTRSSSHISRVSASSRTSIKSHTSSHLSTPSRTSLKSEASSFSRTNGQKYSFDKSNGLPRMHV